MKLLSNIKSQCVLLLIFVSITTIYAEVKPARIFSSNMVLQQGTKIPVWGWADNGEKVSVTLNGNTLETIADEGGKWMVKFPQMQYGGPHTMTIEGENTIIFKNIMIGEVWICSGQSNMAFALNQSSNGKEEIANSDYPEIRLFIVPRKIAQYPQSDIEEGEWVPCSPEASASFSAVGYFFGKKLHQDLNVPVGLIQSTWGGTVAESWTSGNTIKDDPDFKEKYKELLGLDIKNYKQHQEEIYKEILGGEILLKDEGLIDGVAHYAAPDFDDSDWKTIHVPDFWENQGYKFIDGIAWYRKEIILTKEQAQRDCELHLGKIDDSDITWINEEQIGSTINEYNRFRNYPITTGLLKEGKNILAVRVEDTGGRGGISSDQPGDIHLLSGKQKIFLAGAWKFKLTKVDLRVTYPGPNSFPTLLYNGMINPIVPYAIKGVIWYQGESNANRAKQYRRIFPNMITDWRTNWENNDFPFLFVSLANYKEVPPEPGESSWAELREAQTMALKLKGTGMALAIDIGEANDIHPKDKQTVGNRLVLTALKKGYHKDIVYSGPLYLSMKVKENKVEIIFSETGNGLISNNSSDDIKGFSIAGADKQFFWAEAKIVAGNKVVVWCNDVKSPVAVRYAWADNPGPLNLYNKEGLPANPFRTDSWPGITK
ncbi:MAG: beta galactosidase jelly roll domain-containing protein [Bacteroidetes bacterium]|nr:beta galactosidase jelly roll domain-containing protein [Bacteroidota bacterium]